MNVLIEEMNRQALELGIPLGARQDAGAFVEELAGYGIMHVSDRPIAGDPPRQEPA